MTSRSPHDLDQHDIVLSHFSLGRHFDITDRVRAAAGAGCAGIGLYVGEYHHLEQSDFAPARLGELLAEEQICLAEIEVLQGWADPAVVDTERYRAVEATAWRMADAFGCRYVQAIGPYVGSVADAGRAFGRLCDRAADHGLVVGLEFLPFTNIFSATDALAVVEAADRDNGGICVDNWHHERGAGDLDLVRTLPADRVMAIQMSDGPVTPDTDDYVDDCLRHRLAPGEGEFDVGGFVGALVGAGVTVPWSLEVCQETAWDTDGRDHVARAVAAMRSFLI
ncbi:MAG: sugar phosphate isomerase/epimerase family protein [Acidimicrobiales bacterium]